VVGFSCWFSIWSSDERSSLSDLVRVGVIGTSWFADLVHLPHLKSHPQAEIAAVCGRNRELAEEMAVKYGIPSVYTDYREMIEKGGLQAVVIVTPEDVHYAMAMDVLDAGLHVLCEKPLALNATDAKEMYERAEKAGVKHMTFFTYRWMPHYRYLKELVDGGYAGRPFQCHIRYFGSYAREARYLWRFDRRRANGVLGDLGSHMIDLARWLVGDISRVSAHLSTFVERPGPEGEPLDPANDAATLLLEFENGAQGTIQLSAVAHVGERGQEQHVVLHGESGTLEADYSHLDAEIHGVRHDEKQFAALPAPSRLWGDVDQTSPFFDHVGEVFSKQSVGDRAFIDAILADRPVVPSLYEGYKAQEVMDAAIASHESGRWVEVG
jgi:predicted dehydrogenase